MLVSWGLTVFAFLVGLHTILCRGIGFGRKYATKLSNQYNVSQRCYALPETAITCFLMHFQRHQPWGSEGWHKAKLANCHMKTWPLLFLFFFFQGTNTPHFCGSLTSFWPSVPNLPLPINRLGWSNPSNCKLCFQKMPLNSLWVEPQMCFFSHAGFIEGFLRTSEVPCRIRQKGLSSLARHPVTQWPLRSLQENHSRAGPITLSRCSSQTPTALLSHWAIMANSHS